MRRPRIMYRITSTQAVEMGRYMLMHWKVRKADPMGDYVWATMKARPLVDLAQPPADDKRS